MKLQIKKDSKSWEDEGQEKNKERERIVSEWLWDGEAVALGRVRGSDAYAKRKEQISAARANQTPVLPGALLDRQPKYTHMTGMCTRQRSLYEASKGILEYSHTRARMSAGGMIQCPGNVWRAPKAPLSLSPHSHTCNQSNDVVDHAQKPRTDM